MALTGDRVYIQSQNTLEEKQAIDSAAQRLGISSAFLAGRLLSEALRRFVVSESFLQETIPHSSTCERAA